MSSAAVVIGALRVNFSFYSFRQLVVLVFKFISNLNSNTERKHMIRERYDLNVIMQYYFPFFKYNGLSSGLLI